MSSDGLHSDGRTESCGNCCRETPHTVTVELCVESTSDGESPFARQPYRVPSCRECGAESTQPIDEA